MSVSGRVRLPRFVPCSSLGAWGAPANRCWTPLLGGAASLLEYVEIGHAQLSGARSGQRMEVSMSGWKTLHLPGIGRALQVRFRQPVPGVSRALQVRLAHPVAGRALLRGGRTTLKYTLNSLGELSVAAAVTLTVSQQWRTSLAGA